MNKCENVSNIINTVTKILHIMCSKKKRENNWKNSGIRKKYCM